MIKDARPSPSASAPPPVSAASAPVGSIRFPLAWMGALVVVDGSFLLAASAIDHPGWASAVLVIAAVINVPLFLGALLLLRSKF
jgi:hypothetical protein